MAKQKHILLEANDKALKIIESAKNEARQIQSELIHSQKLLEKRQALYDQKILDLETKEKQLVEKVNKIKDTFQKGFFETFIHLKLTREGEQLYLMPSAIVYHNKNYRMKEAFTQSYHHGRSFAGMRTSNASFFKRLGFMLGSIILPVLLPLRITLEIIKKGRHAKELLLSFPYLVLLMTSWSYGEFCGYLFGEGGSAARWR